MNPVSVAHQEPAGSATSFSDLSARQMGMPGAEQGKPLSWPGLIAFAVCGVACFHVAYSHDALSFMILGYLICLLQLALASSSRKAFYFGFAVGLAVAAGQLTCFWSIFGPSAISLWAILAFWTGLFVALTRVVFLRFGTLVGGCLVPFLWTGLEYFRSELYYLRFSWLNAGYAFSGSPLMPFYRSFGMYGIGFLAISLALLLVSPRAKGRTFLVRLCFLGFAISLGIAWKEFQKHDQIKPTAINVAGIQLEFPTTGDVIAGLDGLVKVRPEADLLVLSEYTLDGPVPDRIRSWCRDHKRYLVVGGKDPAPNANFYDTAFVIGPTGDIVFRQAKAVPIQFFQDGLPAAEQRLWESPWGTVGICICYDLSYARVTDRLTRLGAQALIVPTMDIADWGAWEHQLHGRVAPVRSAEYGIPIVRVASSGISQYTDTDGKVFARAGFPGQAQTIHGRLLLANPGSLPLDRWLAPISTGVTALVILWLVTKSATSRSASRKEQALPA
jgi:apolipoprotein N-acyltransferase